MEIKNKIELALDEIRPFLQSDGGDISLVSIENNVVKVKLHGSCTHCSINSSTMKLGVENTIKKYVPEITEVINIQ